VDPIARISKLLDDDSPRKRIAAAVILGELRVKDPAVVSRLVQMARDPVEAYAEAAVEARGQLRTVKALPVLIESLGRSRALQELATRAIAELGSDALPEIRSRLEAADSGVRAVLSQVLPSLGGRQSLELALSGMLGQPWDVVNRITLSARHEFKAMSAAERRAAQKHIEKFLKKPETVADESALRGALKMLGFLELPEAQDVLLDFLSKTKSPVIRLEATTALRFALAGGPTKKALRRLMGLLDDTDGLVARAARESLTVLKIGTAFANELSELSSAGNVEVALWAIARLGDLAASEPGPHGKLAAKALLPVAQCGDRTRSQAAARVLASLPGGDSLLVQALADTADEISAQVLSEVLSPLAGKLEKKLVKQLLAAGAKNLGKTLSIARRQLDPTRSADGKAWADVLRSGMKALEKRDAPRAEAIGALLGRSSEATPADRFTGVLGQLAHHNLDPHPSARQKDAALTELERLAKEGFGVAAAVAEAKKLSDDARYYVGVHFAEKQQFEFKNVGAEILESLSTGRTKLAKAARNKLKLLEL
jgi:hypothetical protein